MSPSFVATPASSSRSSTTFYQTQSNSRPRGTHTALLRRDKAKTRSRIGVTDHGPGISQSKQPNDFRKVRQVDVLP